MPPGSILNLDELPESAYARELRSGPRRLDFDPPIEQQYVAAHQRRVRLRVRVWFALVLGLAITFTIVQARRTGVHSLAFWLHCCATLPCALVLAALAWGRLYQRYFLPAARVLVPLLVGVIAVFVAPDVAQGRDEELAALAVNMIAVFFFAGLMFRASLVAALVILLAFAGTMVATATVTAAALRGLLTLLITAVLSAIVAVDIERSLRKGFLESALIAEMISRDGLSGLMNRRALDEHLLRVWQQAHRDRRLLAVLMIDVDHFKVFNDTYGHQSGDEAIRAVARLLAGFARRPLDLAARYGGEEFVLLLFDLSPERVADLAERLRMAVQNAAIVPDLGGGAPAAAGRRVTVSIGAAVVAPNLGRTPQGALQLADEALYQAKQTGRNRVVLLGAEEYGELRTGSFRVPRRVRR